MLGACKCGAVGEVLSHPQGVGFAVALLPRPHLLLVCSIGCLSEFCRIFVHTSTLAVFWFCLATWWMVASLDG